MRRDRMRYLIINFDNEQYWLEIADDDYALRQIIIDANGRFHVSCSEDCLTEGIINESELAGELHLITQYEFESKWAIATVEERKLWNILKNQYPIGKAVEGKALYSYPQGWILGIGQSLGICKCDIGL